MLQVHDMSIKQKLYTQEKKINAACLSYAQILTQYPYAKRTVEEYAVLF